MAKLSKQKRIILTTIIVLLVVGAGVFSYFMIKQANTPETASESFENTPNFGACQILTTEVIRSANQGDSIATIQEGSRTAVDGLNGEAADGCKFAFTTNKSANNSLTVSIYPYNASEEAFEKENAAATWTEVSGPKPTPYFGEATIDNGETSLYMFRVVPGAKTILLSISQPKNASEFDKADALNLLSDISTKINFGAFERKAAEQVETDTTGDGPGTPPADTPNVIAQPRE